MSYYHPVTIHRLTALITFFLYMPPDGLIAQVDQCRFLVFHEKDGI
ncbi:hypothetical protein ASZ90_015956 [hydrocarbon metagenome]|uniref:Uncharacterized protein n=1 Tax=hydrocarbon metagenome TaxID=938273 RepID=A0A0W8F0R7_9ZZZZ